MHYVAVICSINIGTLFFLYYFFYISNSFFDKLGIFVNFHIKYNPTEETFNKSFLGMKDFSNVSNFVKWSVWEFRT